MIELLLYVDMNCIDASDIIRRVKKHDDVKSVIKNEIILTIKEATPHCPWDAND
tara:strand:+ start:45 stop:206 length:162 start_codon:yes stop_codon:yes gene_type:complete